MPKANIRYADVIAEQKAKEFDEELNRMVRQEWYWFLGGIGGLLLTLVGLVWWFS